MNRIIRRHDKNITTDECSDDDGVYLAIHMVSRSVFQLRKAQDEACGWYWYPIENPSHTDEDDCYCIADEHLEFKDALDAMLINHYMVRMSRYELGKMLVDKLGEKG